MSFTLVVFVENAVDLEAADLNGKSDPYVLVQAKSITDKKLDSSLKSFVEGWKQKTTIKKKELNPTWNETMTFYSLRLLDDTDEGIKLVFKVFDWDLLSRDDKIGNAEIIVKPSELEHQKKYSTSLKLKDCKSGTLNISYSISSFDQEVVDNCDLFQYHSPFTPSTCQLCIPQQYSLLSTATVAGSRCATFSNIFGKGMIIITMTKQAEIVDFRKLAQIFSEEQLREMRKKYSFVVVESREFDVKPDPHCKNKKITNIFEMKLNIDESAGGTKLFGTLRMVLHSNNQIVTYVYVQPNTLLDVGILELARISDNSTFF